MSFQVESVDIDASFNCKAIIQYDGVSRVSAKIRYNELRRRAIGVRLKKDHCNVVESVNWPEDI